MVVIEYKSVWCYNFQCFRGAELPITIYTIIDAIIFSAVKNPVDVAAPSASAMFAVVQRFSLAKSNRSTAG